jgi:hypothetical protein
LLISIAMAWVSGSPQTKAPVDDFFRQNIGLSEEQVTAIHAGQAVSKVLPSRNSSEVFLFSAIHIKATPERYLEYSQDFKRLRKGAELPGDRRVQPPTKNVGFEGIWI